jgi:hypothetical protein
MKVIVAVMSLLCISVPANAQVEMLMIGLCKKVSDDAARLKCFDAIGATTEQTKAEQEPAKVHEWAVVDSKSPIDDSPQVSALLLSDDGESTLMLRCAERKTEAAVIPKGLFAYERGSVVIRLNDLPATSATWSASNNNKALFAPNGVAFVKMLPNNGELFIRSTGHSSRAADAKFKLGAVSAVRDRISAACKWSDVAPKAAVKPKDVAAPVPLAPRQ